MLRSIINEGFVMMLRRVIKGAVLLGALAVASLLGAGLAQARGPEAEALMRRVSAPPVPEHFRALRPEQFGRAKEPGLSPQIRSILRQESRQQLNPPAPHRDILEFGPPFHQDPTTIPEPPPECVPGPNQPCP